MPLTRAEFLTLSLGTAAASLLRSSGARAQGDQLTVMQSEGPRSMDCGDHTAVFTSSILGPMYEALTQYDETLTIQPALATSWTVDPTQTIWTFAIRPNVVFHDGTKLDAAAVAASFGRHLDPKRGLASSARFRGAIGAVDVQDPMTVRFTLKAPYPAFLRLLALNQACIVSPAAEAAGTLGRKPVGTGPYRFVEWNTSDYVLQERFPQYWGQQPYFRTVKWAWSSEAAVMNMSLQTGEQDVVNPVPPVFAAGVKTRDDERLLVGDSAAVYWVALNTQLKPLDDVRVRQALNFATDRDALVKSLLFGWGTPANSPVGPVTFGYDKTVPIYPHDVARARSLLADAGHKDGISIDVAVQEAQAGLAEALQGMWAEAGVTLNVRKMESGVWVAAAFGNPEKKAQQNIGAVIASWAAGTFDADLQLRPLFYSASASPASANLGFFSDKEVDALIDRAGSIGDPKERLEIYAKLQRMIQVAAPHVSLYYPKDLVGTSASVGGIWVIPGGQIMSRPARRI